MSRRIAHSWIGREQAGEIPWQPLNQPLPATRVALVTSAGVARRDDRPFDQEIDLQDPWWSDQSYRVIPDGATEEQVKLFHFHVDCSFGERDLDCVLPMRRLRELQQRGVIGSVAADQYSFMAYVLVPNELLSVSAVEIARRMRAQGIGAAVLIPA